LEEESEDQEFRSTGVQVNGGTELHDGEEAFCFLNEVIHPLACYEELSSVSSRELSENLSVTKKASLRDAFWLPPADLIPRMVIKISIPTIRSSPH
jgi:hypothetical protein